MTELEDLIHHLVRSTRLGPEEARHVVGEVVAFFAESPSEFVVRRHADLHRAGWSNARIYAAIAAEVEARPFAGPKLSERQVRRLIYG